jgi:hypothetical protein
MQAPNCVCDHIEAVVQALAQREAALRNRTTQDGVAFDALLHTLRSPQEACAAKDEIAAEEAGRGIASTPITLEMRGISASALDDLPFIDDAILMDAIAGLRLLSSATACLLFITEYNLARIPDLLATSSLRRQVRELSCATSQAESELACRLRSHR